jgi:CRISPR/Cas system endoribonuclease Cas6 (RAMP superfamily)
MDYSRYSSRQHKKVPMGGLTGTAVLGASETWCLPWLQAASLIHVGKGASMGLGKVTMDLASG